MSSSGRIENVSDTARWVAVYRAMETARPDAIFRDPYAERLAGERGRAIVDAMAHGRSRAWSMIVRTALFDDMLRAERPTCRYEAVSLDLRDEAKRRALFAQLGAESTRAVVMTEGLLVYLTDDDVGALARDLHAQPSFRWWVIDIASPRLLRMMQRDWGKTLAAGNAPFKFAPAAGPGFFKPFGWCVAQFRATLDEARRLKREMRGMWFLRTLMRLYPKR